MADFAAPAFATPGDGSGARLPVSFVVLGSGTALPTENRGSPGYLLRFSDGSGFLVDAGPGSVRAAARAGCPLPRLRGALVTHFHPDHCLDLFALFFGLRNPVTSPQRLMVAGPVGLRDLCERMTQPFGDWVRLPPERGEILELEPGAFQFEVGPGLVQGEALSMPHLGHSLGYRFHGPRKILAYSGDTGPGDAPVRLGRKVDHYVLEAALPDGQETSKHLTPSQAGRIAADSGCAHLCLTHLYPETEKQDVVSAARAFFDGPVTVASDGLELPL